MTAQDYDSHRPHPEDAAHLGAAGQPVRGGPEAAVTAEARGAVLRLCAPDGRPLVSVEAPLLVQVPGEAERLLGRNMPVPFWWTEA
ncbi:hypothetical protein ACPC37_19380 [Streptomyces griseoincarnatus]|uniref:hypothetical protein n=1 Tax=unclassified Streptomyces TaxID=2593676 RepID=UPI000B32E1DE|nr:hypothetical protein [Streptomyces sp. PAM3C]